MALWLKRYKIPLIVLAVIATAFIMLVVFLTGNTIRRGIRIEGADVSGLNTDEARMLLADSVNKNYSGGSFSLRYETREWKFGLDEISYRFLVDDAVSKAFSVGRTGSIFSKVFRASNLLMSNIDLKIETDYDSDKLFAILSNIKSEIDTEQANASVTYNSGNINLTRSKEGKQLDIDRNLKLVENHLKAKNFEGIELDVDVIKPAIAYEDIKEIDTVLSYFSTTFNAGDINRSDNIKLACSRLNGRILFPGDEFSMDGALGPRTVENGYKEAPVIYKNELIKGPGGGICQVTTTLYDAILLAKLQVLERSPHSMPLGYVKPGQDATIAEDSIDFKFTNSHDYPVCLAAGVSGSRINIRVLGRSNSEENTVKLVSDVIAEYPPGEDEIEIDNTLADEEKVVSKEARKGLRVILYRDTYSASGTLLEREKISEDYYKPSKGLIKVNRNYYDKYLSDAKGLQNE